METHYIVHIPVDNDAIKSIECLLQSKDVFTTSFQHIGESTYRVETYLLQKLEHGTETVFLLDRNLLTRIVSMQRGNSVTTGHRVAAGVLAFAQTIDALIEPNIALYELASHEGAEAARSELDIFRIMDSSHPQLFADVAVGRCDRLDNSYIFAGQGQSNSTSPIPFTTRLRSWRASYLALLKIASLELKPSTAESKMLELIHWMDRNFLFVAPALHFANRFFAPNQPKRRLLKSLRSPNRSKAISGIRNAAWDLAIIYQWSSLLDRQDKDKRLAILVSSDRALHDIARSLIAPTFSDDEPINLAADEFNNIWGLERGRRLFVLYAECLKRRKSNDSLNPDITLESVASMIEALESEIYAYFS